jgi:hypothetical protein
MRRWVMEQLALCVLLFSCNLHCYQFIFTKGDSSFDKYEGKVIKGNRNALFLVEGGTRRQFPDFYTYDKMGFNISSIMKVKDEILNSIPMGAMVKAIPAPPPFRPDDYMYHEQCGDPDRMVSLLDLSMIFIQS